MVLPRSGQLAWVVCLTTMLSACAAPPVVTRGGACPAAQGDPLIAYELFFGRSITGGGEVTDGAWGDFVTRVVTPNLPNGYTVFNAVGAWRDPANGTTVHERTKVVLAALPDTPDSAGAIGRIRQAYAAQFHQSAVGMTAMPVCGAF